MSDLQKRVLRFVILKGTCLGFQDCLFPNRHPTPASTSDNRAAIVHVELISKFDPGEEAEKQGTLLLIDTNCP